MRFYVSEVMIPSGKSICRWGFLRPFGPCMEDRHEHYQYRDSCPCRRWKDDLDGEPAICQRSHFRTGERRKRDNEDGHHVFGAAAWDYHQAAVTSFQWHRCKVNIVDTPGHMDFLAEVYRSLAVLDGAILVISAKDGVQAQTRVLFHALRKLNIPTIIFINKIDQVGIDLEGVYQSVRDKLSADIIIKQTVSLSSKITLTENTSAEVWDSVIENNDELLAKYIAGESISQKELAQEEQRRVQDASLLPVYHGSAKNGLGIQQLMDAVIGLFQPTKEQGSAALCGRVFKVEYTDCGQRLVYLRLYSGTLRLRDTVALAGREKLKNHRDAYSIQRGDCSDRYRP